MGGLSIWHILVILAVVAGGGYLLTRYGALGGGKGWQWASPNLDLRFVGAELLSGFASLICGAIFLLGLVLVFYKDPSFPEYPPLTSWNFAHYYVLNAVGVLVALFGLFGLLIARGVRLLVQIERNSRGRPRG